MVSINKGWAPAHLRSRQTRGEGATPRCEQREQRATEKEILIDPRGESAMLALLLGENRAMSAEFSSVRGRV
jgi:hypothetical protein